MTIEQKRRELFEAWWADCKGKGYAPLRYKGGQYVSDAALWSWIGFNAALDAVAIQMPKECDVEEWSESLITLHEGYSAEAVRAAIEYTGLRLKVLP